MGQAQDGFCPVADVYDAMGDRPKPTKVVEAGGSAPPVIVNDALADRILEFLRGQASHDPYQLLREARAAVAELDAERDRLANIVRSHEAQILRMTSEAAALGEREAAHRAALDRVDKALAEFEGMTGAGYQYMAANIRSAIAGKGGAW